MHAMNKVGSKASIDEQSLDGFPPSYSRLSHDVDESSTKEFDEHTSIVKTILYCEIVNCLNLDYKSTKRQQSETVGDFNSIIVAFDPSELGHPVDQYPSEEANQQCLERECGVPEHLQT